jgi:cytochrome c-type biogenesis protein CcmH
MSWPKILFSLTKHFFIFTAYCLLLTAYCLLPTAYSTALAQTPDYDRINEIAKHLNCPTCAGINLADCRTQTCEQWRNQISDLIQQGYSDEEIYNYFTTRFGDQVLQEPPKSGWTLFLWTLPLAALLLGGIWLFSALRGWSNQKTVSSSAILSPVRPAATHPPITNTYLHQVEKDLQEE